VGAAWGYAWGGANWNHGNVNVNVNQNNSINNNINRNNYANKIGGGGQGQWQHDPDHRKGVAYRDSNTQQKYGQQGRGSADARQDYRGHTPDDKGRTAQAADRQGMQDHKGSSAQTRQTGGQQKTSAAFDGMNRGGNEAKMDSDRGRASMQGMSSERPGSGGGMSRGAGGGGRHR